MNQQEKIVPVERHLTREELYHRYLAALQNPTETRHLLTEELKDAAPVPVYYSELRKIHILSRSGNPEDSVVALGNSGCFEFNSSEIYKGTIIGNEHKDIQDADEGDGPLLYAFTKPQDKLVVQGEEETMIQLLHKIHESFAAVGINLTQDIIVVPSITQWLEENKPDNLMPHVLSPRSLYGYAKTDEERYRFGLQSLLHATLYSKRGFQEFCREHNIPTPATRYDTFEPGQEAAVADGIQEYFGNYGTYVVTKDAGVGGHGVHKGVTPEHIANGLLPTVFSPGETIMTQRQLPLLHKLSPCTRFYIGADRPPIMMGSTVQRFLDTAGSQYGGNKWHTNMLMELEALAPGFTDIHTILAQKLSEVGYIGIENTDDLLIDSADASSLGEEGAILKRELNARPAMSHWISIIETGNINDLPITRVHTKTEIIIPDEVFYHPDFINKLNQIHPDIRVIVGTRYRVSLNTYLAFAANDNVSEEVLNETESKILSLINASQSLQT